MYLCLERRREDYKVDDKRYIQSLINEGEHQQQDFKYRVEDAVKLAKSVSAFANTDGGRLLIGVRDDGHMSGVRDEEEIYMMHQAAYRYCRPQSSIKIDTFHVVPPDSNIGSRKLRTIVIATVPPSNRRPVYAIDEDGHQRAYIRIADENIVASPVHLAIWREMQNPKGTMITYTDTVRKLINTLNDQHLTLNQLVRRSGIPRHKVITILARLIRFRIAQWEHTAQQFLFSLVSS